MRFVVAGIGAIGGVVAAGLALSGRQVTAVARGAHLDAVRAGGLTLHTPAGSRVVALDVAASIEEAAPGDDDVVLLCTKSQDTVPLVQRLAATGRQPLIACLQNGVENERVAARFFDRVLGAMVALPAAYLHPGEVTAYGSPRAGVIEVGRYPSGEDAEARAVAAALDGAGLVGRAVGDISAAKYAKLMWNLGNAARAAFADVALVDRCRKMAQSEARAVLTAAGIAVAGEAGRPDPMEREGIVRRPADGGRHPGGSTWQSLKRHAGGVETDYLNGEIVLLGRLHRMPAPVNRTLCRVMHTMAAGGAEPGSFDPATFERLLADAVEAEGRP